MRNKRKLHATTGTGAEETIERQLGELGAQQQSIRARLAALDTDGLETREMITKLNGSVATLESTSHTLFELVCERMESLDRSSHALFDLVCARIEDRPAATLPTTGNGEDATTTPVEERTPPDSMPDAAREGGDRAAKAAAEEAGGEGKSDAPGEDDEEAQDATTTEPEDKSGPGEEDVKKMEGATTPQDEAAAETSEEDKQPQATPEGASDIPTDGEAGADAIPESTDPPPSPTEGERAAPVRAAPSKREKKILRRLTTIERRLKRKPSPEPMLQDVIAALGAIRTALSEQHEAITAAVALTPADQSPPDPRMPPAWQAWQEVMTRLDGMARMIRPVPAEPAPSSSTTETPALPTPTTTHPGAPVPVDTAGVSPSGPGEVLAPAALDEILAAVAALRDAPGRPRRGFARFAWVSILVVFLAAGALGVIAQQQYTLLDLPDTTHGWKERVWELSGEEIARCITASTARGGTCDVTVEPAGGAAATTP